MFQFHKVQLTQNEPHQKNLYKMFQFHKVQLTPQEAKLSNRANNMFQFHKVQLTLLCLI